MKTCNLIIQSKNQKSLSKFVRFLDKNLEINFNYLKKSIQKRTKKKVITLLKSPHVNKKAQEQFELRLFSKQIKVDTPQSLKLLIFLKKVKLHLFPDVRIKVKFCENINQNRLLRKKILNPDSLNIKKIFQTYKNLDLKELKKLRSVNYPKTFSPNLNLLKMFDAYGKY